MPKQKLLNYNHKYLLRKHCFLVVFLLFSAVILSAQNFLYVRLSEFQNTSIENAKRKTNYLITDTGKIILSQRVYNKDGFLIRFDTVDLQRRLSTIVYHYFSNEKKLVVDVNPLSQSYERRIVMYFDSTNVLTKQTTDSDSNRQIVQEYNKTELGFYSSILSYFKHKDGRLTDSVLMEYPNQLDPEKNQITVKESYKYQGVTYTNLYLFNASHKLIQERVGNSNQYRIYDHRGRLKKIKTFSRMQFSENKQITHTRILSYRWGRLRSCKGFVQQENFQKKKYRNYSLFNKYSISGRILQTMIKSKDNHGNWIKSQISFQY